MGRSIAMTKEQEAKGQKRCRPIARSRRICIRGGQTLLTGTCVVHCRKCTSVFTNGETLRRKRYNWFNWTTESENTSTRNFQIIPFIFRTGCNVLAFFPERETLFVRQGARCVSDYHDSRLSIPCIFAYISDRSPRSRGEAER